MTSPATLDGRTLRLKLDVTVRPPAGAELGETDAAVDVGKKIALEVGLLAQRIAPPGSTVEVERQITAY